MTTQIVLIRHGETDWNVVRRYQGMSDTLLNETGEQQAKVLACVMRGEQCDAMASSPSKRAWNTAQPIAAALGFTPEQIVPDPRLMERAYGVAEGLTATERERRYPGDFWEGLETIEELTERVLDTVNDYAHRHPNQRLIMVTHGTWINVLLAVLSDGEVGHGKSVIANTSRTYLMHDADGWHIGEIGVIDHLDTLV